MTIQVGTRRAGPYATNGVTTAFAFTFKVFAAADVLVTKTTGAIDTVALLTTEYTVSLNADQDNNPGGTVTFLVAPNGPTLTITSQMGVQQPAIFTNQGGFYPRVLNDALDRVTIGLQQHDELLDRVPQAPIGGGTVGQFPVLNAAGGFDYSNGTTTDAALRANLLASGGSDLVGFLSAGASAVARTAQAKMRERVSILDFGPATMKDGVWSSGWSGTDAYAALLAAKTYLESVQGGTIEFPEGRFYFSQFPAFTDTGIVLEGVGWTENAGIAGASTFSVPYNYQGTIICPGNNVAGPIFYGVSDNASAAAWAALPTGAAKFEFRSARGSGLRNLMFYGGGTTGTINGADVRTIVEFDKVRFENFPGDGLRIDASTHTETTAYGIADRAIFRDVVVRGNGRHGLRVRGNDANVILFDTLDAALNGGWGVYEQGQLGNVYLNAHFATNNQATGAARTALEAESPQLVDTSVGAFNNTSTIGAHLLLGCYTEIGLGGKSHIITPAMVVGGNIASDASLTTSSTAYVQNGAGNIERGVLRGINRVGTRVGMAVGSSVSKVAFSWGADQDAGNDGFYKDLQMTYNTAGADKWWGLHRAGGAAAVSIQFPGSASTINSSIDAPAFPSGYFDGGDGFGYLIRFTTGTAAPVAGTWARGSVVWNRDAAVGQPNFWRCTVAGTPGTWVAGPNL